MFFSKFTLRVVRNCTSAKKALLILLLLLLRPINSNKGRRNSFSSL